MKLLIDTHILVWMVLGDQRLTAEQHNALANPDNDIVLSAVNAYELAHLQHLRRIPLEEPIDQLQELVGFELADLPASAWTKVKDLPDLHRDPLDRLLVAHALVSDMTLVSADQCIRQYPVMVI